MSWKRVMHWLRNYSEETSKRRLRCSIKLDLKEVCHGNVIWTEMAQDEWAVIITVMNLRDPYTQDFPEQVGGWVGR
jgi:hypothetical protein